MKLFSLIALLFSLSAGAGEIPQSTFVRFNTVCATCHEGECSGRLSFQSGVSAALGHMQRHLGKVTEIEASDLFGLIKYTKERCAHYPVSGKYRTMASGHPQIWRHGEARRLTLISFRWATCRQANTACT
jgi:hypothetical protein